MSKSVSQRWLLPTLRSRSFARGSQNRLLWKRFWEVPETLLAGLGISRSGSAVCDFKKVSG